MRPTERVRLCPRSNRACYALVYWAAAVRVRHNRRDLLAARGYRHGERGLEEIGEHVLIDGTADYTAASRHLGPHNKYSQHCPVRR